MISKEDQQQAKNIIENKPLYDFLQKYLIEPQEIWTPQAVDALSNEQLGERVKVDVLAQQKIVTRFNNIKRMAGTNGGAGAPIAPK
jgi:glutaredoxin-related protein